MLIRGCRFPEDLWFHAEHQVWVRPEGEGQAVLGITEMGIRLSGEIYMCRPKPVGQALEPGRAMAVVELAKAIVSVKSPVAGQVLAVNEALAERPELVHRDPFGAGWLLRVQLSDWAQDQGRLVHGDAVPAAMEEHARLNLMDEKGPQP